MEPWVLAMAMAVSLVPDAAAQGIDTGAPALDLFGRRVRVTDSSGCTWDGTATRVERDGVQVENRFGCGAVPWASVVHLERKGDSILDGALKGSLVAVVVAPMASQGYTSGGAFAKGFARALVTFGAIGALVDALNEDWTLVPVSGAGRSDRAWTAAPPAPGRSRVSKRQRVALCALGGAAIGGAIAGGRYGEEGVWVGLYPGAVFGALVGAVTAR